MMTSDVGKQWRVAKWFIFICLHAYTKFLVIIFHMINNLTYPKATEKAGRCCCISTGAPKLLAPVMTLAAAPTAR